MCLHCFPQMLYLIITKTLKYVLTITVGYLIIMEYCPGNRKKSKTEKGNIGILKNFCIFGFEPAQLMSFGIKRISGPGQCSLFN